MELRQAVEDWFFSKTWDFPMVIDVESETDNFIESKYYENRWVRSQVRGFVERFREFVESPGIGW